MLQELAIELRDHISSYLVQTREDREARLNLSYTCRKLYATIVPSLYRHFSVGWNTSGRPFPERIIVHSTLNKLRHQAYSISRDIGPATTSGEVF